MVLNDIRFFEFAKSGLRVPLKSFNDSLLFYYLGHLAGSQKGELFEIGGGGSSYLMCELSENCNKRYTLCDTSEWFHNLTSTYYTTTNYNFINDTSENLSKYNLPNFSYCHIDGNKDFNITYNDLIYCIDHLEENGLICQDDYGNNKWPTITQAVFKALEENKIKTILIGDSSAWFTKPEYYDYWINKLSTDREFYVLGNYIGVQGSDHLSYFPKYFFLNTLTGNTNGFWRYAQASGKYDKSKYSQEELDYLQKLHKHSRKGFLMMPYFGQSTAGQWL